MTAATFQVNLLDDESWTQEILETPGGVIQVVECYREWCGPCKAVISSFYRMSLDLGDCPIKFYTANVDKIEALKSYREGCKPQFLFYKDGQIAHEVSGVDYPQLSKQILSLTSAV